MEKRTPPKDAHAHPATPRRVLDIAVDGKLKSTPSNRGSASVAEHLSGILVDDVSPSILADIQNHATCTVETMLKGLLSLCLPADQRQNPPADLLDQCLKAVLPICNTQDHPLETNRKQRRVDKEAQADGLGLRQYLMEYCETKSDETARYRPFVYAFNHAFRALHKVDVPLRKPSDLHLFFHRNDPKLITAIHHGEISQRKPDIVLVSLDAARHAFALGDLGSWADYALKTSAEPPRNDFQWGGLLSVAELKQLKSKLPSLPSEYTFKPADPIPPQPLPSDPYEPFEILPPLDIVQLSDNAMPKPSNSAPSAERRRSKRIASLLTSSDKARPTSSTSSGRKRKRDVDTGSSGKRAKKEPVISRRRSAMLQSALYAAERVSHAFWISHTINLVVIDDVAYVWWYDNEGAIQSHGINFVQDLPYFLVLLLCFQRFTPENWGIISTFRFDEEKADQCLFSFPSSPLPSAVDIVINHMDKLHEHFGIVGRATQMLLASSQSKDPRDVRKSLGPLELVLKVYWPEASRVGEGQIIEAAQRIGEQNDDVKGHLPDLICSYDFVEYSTERIRAAFGIVSKGHRLLRVMLFRRLYPITDLIGQKFWKVFWECFRCHHHLWLGGVEHNDISVRNLMYDKLNEDRGILNDYDLAHLDGSPRPSGTERTGTMPFMALDLLTDDAWEGKVTRRYRHDCESFAWVLLWICCRYDGGKEISNPPLGEFITGDYNQCFAQKHSIISKLSHITATASYKTIWNVVVDLLTLFITQRYEQELNVLRGILPTEPTIDETVQSCRKVIEGEGLCVNLP